MLYKDLKPIIYDEDNNLLNIIFENGKFSFAEPIIIDQISMYDVRDQEIAKENANKFGCRIDSNGDDIWIPAGLQFTIAKGRDPYTEMIISRHGATFYPNYVDDTCDISVELTKIGEKLVEYANEYYTGYITVYDAYIQIKNIETIFGVNIIK